MIGEFGDGIQELAIVCSTNDRFGYNLVPLLTGDAGQGKSSTVASLFRNKRCEVLSASLYEPVDFGGYPCPAEDRKSIQHLPPQWALFDENEPAALFLDEVTGCHPSTQNALMRLVLERRIGACHVLPRCLKVVAACNPPEILGGAGHPLVAPLANRFVHVRFEMNSNAFIQALEQNTFPVIDLYSVDCASHNSILAFWKLRFAGFLRRFPSMKSSKPEEEDIYPNAFASPRSIEMALRLASTCDLLGLAPFQNGKPNANADSVFLRLLQGSIGTSVATAFVTYLMDTDIPTPDAILGGTSSVDYSKLMEDRIYLLFAGLSAELVRLEPDHMKFFLASLAMCEQIERLQYAKKMDAGFVAVRNLCQLSWLNKVASIAKEINEIETMQKAIRAAFGDNTQLANLAQCLEIDDTARNPTEAKNERARIRL